jgi:hypothetical protein
MTIEVVGRDVEHRRHARPERLDRLELERGDLGDDEAAGRERERVGGERSTDVAAHQHRARRGGDQGAGERRGGRLAVGPRDGDGVSLHGAPAELELADHRRPTSAGGRELRAVHRHARTDHDELGAGEGRRSVDQVHALGGEGGDVTAQRSNGLEVGGAHLRLGGRQQASGSHSALREADDGDPSPGQRRQPLPPPRCHWSLLEQLDHARTPVTVASAW